MLSEMFIELRLVILTFILLYIKRAISNACSVEF